MVSRKRRLVGSGRLETCWSCRRPVFLAERLVTGGKLRHRTCFTCKRCGNQLNPVGFYETEEGHYVCETCPDEEKREEMDAGLGSRVTEEEESSCTAGGRIEPSRDEYSLNFEMAMEATLAMQNPSSEAKRKFLQDFVSDSFEESESAVNFGKSQCGVETSASEVEVFLPEEKPEVNLRGGLRHQVLDGSHLCADRSLKNLNLKTMGLFRCGRDEPESMRSDLEDFIDDVIREAVEKVDEKSNLNLSKEVKIFEEKSEDASPVVVNDGSGSLAEESGDGVGKNVSGEESVCRKDDEWSEKEKEDGQMGINVHNSPTAKANDYPKDLNPFAEEEDEEGEEESKPESKPSKPPVTPRRAPIPAARAKTARPRKAAFDQSGRKIIEAPTVNLNPFWSDGEPSSDEDQVTKPVPAPRTTCKSPEEDSSLFSRSRYGSFSSVNSLGSSVGSPRRKKGPAPQPPSNANRSLQPAAGSRLDTSLSPTCRSPSPSASIRSHRKSKPAPPPPISKPEGTEMAADKKEKNYENKVKQNLSVPDKSSYGKWKRKKVPAPALPIPQRRRILPLPLSEFYRELEDLEIQQRELERQGVTIEQAIRGYEGESVEESVEESGEKTDENGGKELEGMILQLFDIVNQKNELFRKQAELMYLRRQQRLEEEHADIEYQIRCLMGRPERNKTDSDKAQEEELIRRLIEVVERRNEIIECLDMDRKREVEEDRSIHHHLEAFAGKKEPETDSPEIKRKSISKVSPSLLKLVMKKKGKKEKGKDASPKDRRLDADKDVDEGINDGEDEEEEEKEEAAAVKKSKAKKKWFAKT